MNNSIRKLEIRHHLKVFFSKTSTTVSFACFRLRLLGDKPRYSLTDCSKSYSKIPSNLLISHTYELPLKIKTDLPCFIITPFLILLFLVQVLFYRRNSYLRMKTPSLSKASGRYALLEKP